MNYTILDFQKQFPDNEACLNYLFESLYSKPKCPECKRVDSYHLRKGSSHFICNCGKHQISPKAGTIFEKSRTDLVKWFFAIFLMSNSRNGVAALEIQRHTKVTYKTAWRMMNQIRKIMKENDHFLFGEIESDETYIGGKRKGKRGRGASGKTIVAGTLQRGGKLNTKIVKNVKASTLIDQFKDKVAKGSHLLTDELRSYKKIARELGLTHRTVNHGAGEYAKKDGTSVNLMENFWSQLKRSLDGTYHVVSPRHLPLYVSEFQFRRNHQNQGVHLFDLLLGRVSLRRA